MHGRYRPVAQSVLPVLVMRQVGEVGQAQLHAIKDHKASQNHSVLARASTQHVQGQVAT